MNAQTFDAILEMAQRDIVKNKQTREDAVRNAIWLILSANEDGFIETFNDANLRKWLEDNPEKEV